MKIIKQFIILGVLIIILLLPCFVFANATLDDGSKSLNPLKKIEYVGGISGYMSTAKDPIVIVASVVTVLLGLLGVIFLILMIYGGFLWMTDRGNEEQVKKAQGLIKSAIIGLIIVVAAYAITVFINIYVIQGTATLK